MVDGLQVGVAVIVAGDDVVDPVTGLDGLGLPSAPLDVLAAADPFVTTPIDASGLPTT